MKAWIMMAARNLWRNKRRSALTAGAIAAATAFLILLVTHLAGFTEFTLTEMTRMTGHARICKIGYKKAERYLSLNYPINEYAALIETLEKENWIKKVVARIKFGALMDFSNNNVPGLGSAIDPAREKDTLELDRHIVSGRYFSKPTGEVLIGLELANKLHARSGDTLTLIGKTRYGSMSGKNVRVAGVFDLGASLLNRTFYITLADAGYFLDLENAVTELLVFGYSHSEAAAGVADIRAKRLLPNDLVITGWFEEGIVAGVYPILKFVLALTTGVIGLLAFLVVLNTMLMVVMERATEIGLLRALGSTPLEVILLMVLEAAFLGLAGGLFGATLGTIGGLYLERHGIYIGDVSRKIPIPISDTIHGKLSPVAVVYILLFAILVSIIGAAYPSFKAGSIQPASAMRKK
jgi:putative ABC transport system permease protein